MTETKNKKMGRPEKYDDEFYKMIVEEHDIKKFSLTKLAKYHNASVTTVTRWIKKGREMNEQTQS